MERDIRNLRSAYRKCTLCATGCGVSRGKDALGACGNDDKLHIYSAQISQGEESTFSPTFEIFATGCNLRCRDCHQREYWPYQEGFAYLDAHDVVDEIGRLGDQIKSVSFLGGNPDQSLAGILGVIRLLEAAGGRYPYVFNSNFMFSASVVNVLNRTFDVFVPDMKFGSDACAFRIAGARKYFTIVSANILRVHDRNPIFIRHMPREGHWKCCTLQIIEWFRSIRGSRQVELELLESLYVDNSRQLLKAQKELQRRPTANHR